MTEIYISRRLFEGLVLQAKDTAIGKNEGRGFQSVFTGRTL